MAEATQKHEAALKELLPPAWFGSDTSKVLIRLYVSALDSETIADLLTRLQPTTRLDHAVAVIPCEMVNAKIASTFPAFAWREQFACHMRFENVPIPDGFYCLVASPYRQNAGELSEYEVKCRIERLTALIGIAIGPTLLYKLAGEFTLIKAGLETSFTSPVIRVPQPCERPSHAEEPWVVFREVSEQIFCREDEVAGRLRLALEYLASGTESSSFLDYWMALEIAVGGNANTIRAFLQKAYPSLGHRGVDEQLGLMHFRDWRVKFVHHGAKIHLSAEVERLLHFMFLDIAAVLLKLPQRSILLNAAQSMAIDLRSIKPLDRGNAVQTRSRLE